MIEEQIDFNNAVEEVCDWVKANSNWGETLLIVTGDHECGYLWGPGSNPEFLPIPESGAGLVPPMQWYSGGHSNALIPLFGKGPLANILKGWAAGDDPVRGAYIDNTQIAELVFLCLEQTR
jgi:alkaline phosphatase